MTELGQLPLLRQSERAAFKRCQWRWYQSYVRGLQPIVERFKETADFGTLFHVALAEYYLPGTIRGPHPAETWDKLAKDNIASIKTYETVDDELVATWEDFHGLGIELAEAYIERYQGDPHWDILDAERRFNVLIPDVREPRRRANGRRGYVAIARLVGTIDLVYRDLNEETKYGPAVKMTDHKTVSRIEVNHLTLDEQASTYIAVGTHALRQQKLIGPREVIKGMEYNFIKRAKIDRRPRDDKGMARNKPLKKHYIEAIMAACPDGYNAAQLAKETLGHLDFEATCTLGLTVLGDVSADQSTDNFKRYFVPRTPKERQRQLVRISEEARVMDDVRHGRLPVLKTPQKDCYYCPYFDLCELDETGDDTSYFIETTMKQRDPYSDHRDEALNSKKVTGGT